MNDTFHKNTKSFSNFGFSSILLMFIMICIVTLSVLALLTANTDYKLSQKVADNTSEYYLAEEKAYLTLSSLDAILASCYTPSSESFDGKDLYYSSIESSLKKWKGEKLTIDSNKHTICYQEKITNNQFLEVEIKCEYPTETNGDFYTINKWQVVVYSEEGNTSLNVIQ